LVSVFTHLTNRLHFATRDTSLIHLLHKNLKLFLLAYQIYG
jgi:hypothetical protein